VCIYICIFVTLTTWHPLFANVGTIFAHQRRSLSAGKVRWRTQATEFIYIYIYQLTNSMELSTTREATRCSSFGSFPAFHGTRMFNTEFTTALHLLLSSARLIQSTSPHPTSPRSILMLSTHRRIRLPSGLFPSGSLSNNLYAFLFCICIYIYIYISIRRFSSTIL
jgi:hypothetical protein